MTIWQSSADSIIILPLNSFEWSIRSSSDSKRFYMMASQCFINARATYIAYSRVAIDTVIDTLVISLREYRFFHCHSAPPPPLLSTLDRSPLSDFFVVPIDFVSSSFLFRNNWVATVDGSEPNREETPIILSVIFYIWKIIINFRCGVWVCARPAHNTRSQRTEWAPFRHSHPGHTEEPDAAHRHTIHLNDLLHQSFDKSKHIIDKMRPKIRIQLTGEYFKWKTKRAVTMVRMPLDMANYQITNDGIVHFEHVSVHPTPTRLAAGYLLHIPHSTCTVHRRQWTSNIHMVQLLPQI